MDGAHTPLLAFGYPLKQLPQLSPCWQGKQSKHDMREHDTFEDYASFFNKKTPC